MSSVLAANSSEPYDPVKIIIMPVKLIHANYTSLSCKTKMNTVLNIYMSLKRKHSNTEYEPTTTGKKAHDQDNFFFPVALRPNAGHGLLILEVSRSHTTTHHSR